MSVDDDMAAEQVLGDDEEEMLCGLAAQLERNYQQLELDALHAAGELLRRETNSLKASRTVVEAQQRAEFMRRLSAIVTDACCKLEAKMHVSFLLHKFCTLVEELGLGLGLDRLPKGNT